MQQNEDEWIFTIHDAQRVDLKGAAGVLEVTTRNDTFSFAYSRDHAEVHLNSVPSGLIHQVRIRAVDAGDVTLALDGQKVISVRPAKNLESWELTSTSEGMIAVCGSGGGLSVFEHVSKRLDK